MVKEYVIIVSLLVEEEDILVDEEEDSLVVGLEELDDEDLPSSLDIQVLLPSLLLAQ
jgi:hypothetical protein